MSRKKRRSERLENCTVITPDPNVGGVVVKFDKPVTLVAHETADGGKIISIEPDTSSRDSHAQRMRRKRRKR